MIVSRSLLIAYPVTTMNYWWNCAVEKHLRTVSRAASQSLCLLQSWQVFHDRLLLGRCFWGFVLHVLEYCSAACTRFDVTWCTLFMVLYLGCMCCVGYTRGFGHTSAHLYAASRQNLLVPQDFYSPVSISVEQFCWPRIWWCGTCGFQEQGQSLFIGIAACSLFVSYCFPLLFFPSMG